MAGQKISGMTVASSLAGTEKVEVTQGGNTRYTTTQDIADLGGGGAAGFTQGAQVRISGAVSIGDNSQTTIDFNAEDWDLDTMHDLVTDPKYLTFNTAGLYLVTIGAIFASNSTGYRYAALYGGGSTLLFFDPKNAVNGTSTQCNVTQMLDIPTALIGYTIEVRVLQNSGGPLNLIGCLFTAQKIAEATT